MSRVCTCGDTILWTELLPTRKGHPLDPDEVKFADLDTEKKLIGLIAVPENLLDPAWVVSQHTMIGELRGHTLYRSHFARCPDADKHRGQAQPTARIRRQI